MKPRAGFSAVEGLLNPRPSPYQGDAFGFVVDIYQAEPPGHGAGVRGRPPIWVAGIWSGVVVSHRIGLQWARLHASGFLNVSLESLLGQ